MNIDSTHPFYTGELILPTSTIDVVINKILYWYTCSIPGGVLWSYPRAGKSTAIEYIKINKAKIFNIDVPIFSYIADTKDYKKSPNNFYKSLLNKFNWAEEIDTSHIKGGVTDNENRLVKLFTSRAIDTPEKKLIFIIDEAQYLGINELELLKSLTNKVRANGVKVISVLLGEPELNDKRKWLKQSRKTHLISRFFAQEERVPGLRSRKDIENLLRGYDLFDVKHKGKKCSTSNYFAPKAYREGFRLQNYSKEVWELFTRTSEKYKQPYLDLEISTEIFFIYCMHLFYKINKQDNEELLLTTQFLEEAMTPEVEKLIFDYSQTIVDYN